MAKRKMNKKEAENLIFDTLKSLEVEICREYKFLTDRKFKFDFAIPLHKIAIEYEGGIFTGGRHTSALGYAKDCEKYNLAVLNGWRLLRYTIKDIKQKNWQEKIKNDVKILIQTKH